MAVSVDVTCSVSRVTPPPVAVSVTTRMTGGDGVTEGETPAGRNVSDGDGDPEPPPSVDVVDGVGSALLLDGAAVRVTATDRLTDAEAVRDAEPLPDREPVNVALGEPVDTADTLPLPLPLPVSDGLVLADALRDGVTVTLPDMLGLVDALTLPVRDAEMEPDTEPVTLRDTVKLHVTDGEPLKLDVNESLADAVRDELGVVLALNEVDAVTLLVSVTLAEVLGVMLKLPVTLVVSDKEAVSDPLTLVLAETDELTLEVKVSDGVTLNEIDGEVLDDREPLVLKLALADCEAVTELVKLPDVDTDGLPVASAEPVTVALPVKLALTDAETLAEASVDCVGVTLRPDVGLTDGEAGGELLTLGDALALPATDAEADTLAISDDDADREADVDGEPLALMLVLAVCEKLVEPVELPVTVTDTLPVASTLPLRDPLTVVLPLTDAETLTEAAVDFVGVTLRPDVGLTDGDGGGELLTLGDVLVLPATEADAETLAVIVGEIDVLAVSDGDVDSEEEVDGETLALTLVLAVCEALMERVTLPDTDTDGLLLAVGLTDAVVASETLALGDKLALPATVAVADTLAEPAGDNDALPLDEGDVEREAAVDGEPLALTLVLVV